jgi:hypothetical protein
MRIICSYAMLLETKTHLRPSVASGDQLHRSSLDSVGVSRTTLSGSSKFNEDNLKPRALTRPREQIRPTAQADERTGEEVLRVQTCGSVHELLPYLVDSGDGGHRLPRLQTEALRREAGRMGPAELMGEPERGIQAGNGVRRTRGAAGVRYLRR